MSKKIIKVGNIMIKMKNYGGRDTTAIGRGKYSGQFFKKYLTNEMNRYEILLDNMEYRGIVEEISAKVKNVFPIYWDEAYGVALGASVDPLAYFASLCKELNEEEKWCTTIVHRNLNGWIFSHNEDNDYTLEENCTLSKISTEQGNFLYTIDYATNPFGSGISWNSTKDNKSIIIKSINDVTDFKVNVHGIPRGFLWRHISSANSISEAIERCHIKDRASGYHVTFMEVNSTDNGRVSISSVEVSPDKVSVKEIQTNYAHSNHYLHEDIVGNKIITNKDSSSLFRLDLANELNNNVLHFKRQNVLNVLEHRGTCFKDSIFAIKSDEYSTFANMTVDTAEYKLYLKIYGKGEITFDLKTLN
jgi:hypothetical protein